MYIHICTILYSLYRGVVLHCAEIAATRFDRISVSVTERRETSDLRQIENFTIIAKTDFS